MAKVLTTGTPWRVIVVFALPLLAGNIVQQLYQFTDAVVVGRHLGIEALASVGATTSLLLLLLGFAWGLTTGFAIPTAQAFGAGDQDGVRRSVAAGVILTGSASLLLTVGGVLMVEPALVLLRTPEELLPQATAFGRVSFLGVGALMFFNFLAAIIRAIGDSHTPLVFLVVSCVLNVGLVLLFVGPLGLGVGGAAMATSMSQAVSVALCLVFVRRRVPVLHVQRRHWRVTRAELGRHLRLGLPFGFQTSIIAIGSLAVQVRLNTLGPDAVAAYTTAARIDALGVTLLQSLGLAVSMYVAQNLGGARPDRIILGVRQALIVAVLASATVGATMFIACGTLMRLFVGDGADQVVAMATQLLRVNASLYSILGVLFVLRGALQGLGHTRIPMLTGVIELAMRLGTAIILGAAFGFAGIIWGTPLAWSGAVALLVPAYIRARRHLALLPEAAHQRALPREPVSPSAAPTP